MNKKPPKHISKP